VHSQLSLIDSRRVEKVCDAKLWMHTLKARPTSGGQTLPPPEVPAKSASGFEMNEMIPWVRHRTAMYNFDCNFSKCKRLTMLQENRESAVPESDQVQECSIFKI
jgi:hypothetical protein